MPYSGHIQEIRFGQLGLMYDPAQQDIPNGALIRADNVQYYNGVAERAWEVNDWMANTQTQSTPFWTNQKPTTLHRYFPLPSIERHLAITDDGLVWKYNNPFQRIQMTAQSGSPQPLSVNGLPMIVSGGSEIQGNPKKEFIFTGNSQVQVVYGDAITYQNISNPAADWANSAPTGASVYQNRLCAYGNLSNPHMLYVSTATDQENFTGANAAFISIFPGEGDALIASFVYKGRLFLFKRPYGVYYIETQGSPNPSNWYAAKISSSVGIASPRSYFEGANDLYFLSNDGTIASFTAAFSLGDIYQGDVLASLANASIFRNIIRKQYLYNSFARYLPSKKIGIFGFTSFVSPDGRPDSFVYIDFNTNTPRISWHRYHNQTFSDCTYYKDSWGQDQFLFADLNYINNVYDYGIPGAYYPIWNNTNLPFRVQTPHMNMGVNGNKLFDFFELNFESTNAWPLAVDIYVDSKYQDTFIVQPYYGAVLTPNIFGPSTPQYSNPEFVLDQDYLAGRGARVKMHKLNGRGQTISFVIRDGNVLAPPYDGAPLPDDDQGSMYPYRLVGIKVYYRVAGQDQKAQTS